MRVECWRSVMRRDTGTAVLVFAWGGGRGSGRGRRGEEVQVDGFARNINCGRRRGKGLEGWGEACAKENRHTWTMNVRGTTRVLEEVVCWKAGTKTCSSVASRENVELAGESERGGRMNAVIGERECERERRGGEGKDKGRGWRDERRVRYWE